MNSEKHLFGCFLESHLLGLSPKDLEGKTWRGGNPFWGGGHQGVAGQGELLHGAPLAFPIYALVKVTYFEGILVFPSVPLYPLEFSYK